MRKIKWGWESRYDSLWYFRHNRSLISLFVSEKKVTFQRRILNAKFTCLLLFSLNIVSLKIVKSLNQNAPSHLEHPNKKEAPNLKIDYRNRDKIKISKVRKIFLFLFYSSVFFLWGPSTTTNQPTKMHYDECHMCFTLMLLFCFKCFFSSFSSYLARK